MLNRSRINLGLTVLLLGAAVALVAALSTPGVSADKPAAAPYRSPTEVAFSPDGKLLAASDHTAGAVAIIDPAGGKVLRQVALKGDPAGVAWSGDSKRLYVAELGVGTVAEVDAAGGKVLRRLEAGPRVCGLAVASKSNVLVATNSGLDSVSVIDLVGGKEKKRIAVVRDPENVAISPDEKLAIVSNCLPMGDATDANQASDLSIIDLEKLAVAATVKLPGGSMQLRGVTVSPDGRWVYAAHALGRFTLPTTQLDRGWINTNALSIIDLVKREHYATVLLDRLTEGAADPWQVAISPDGRMLYVTLAGVHQLATIDLEKLHLLMDGKDLPPEPAPDPKSPVYRAPRHLSAIWGQIKADPSARKLLANDLAALYGAGLLIRTRLDCSNPRGLTLSPDGKQLAVAAYYSGTVLLAEPESGKVTRVISMGDQPAMDDARQGEMIFHDATYSFQHWLSCSTCHPEGRADGLNWDLLNDGIGNPKNTRSLLLSDKTPPSMSLGVRANYEVAAAAGFRFILFREPSAGETDAVKAYLRAMKPERNPFLLPNGEMSPKAKKGKAIFESAKAGCSTCHPAPLYTDLQLYDVGTLGKLDRNGKFDTPTLVEAWRTAPYLHDGSAKTMLDVLTTRNQKGTHGSTSQLSKDEIDALVEFLLSL